MRTHTRKERRKTYFTFLDRSCVLNPRRQATRLSVRLGSHHKNGIGFSSGVSVQEFPRYQCGGERRLFEGRIDARVGWNAKIKTQWKSRLLQLLPELRSSAGSDAVSEVEDWVLLVAQSGLDGR